MTLSFTLHLHLHCLAEKWKGSDSLVPCYFACFFEGLLVASCLRWWLRIHGWFGDWIAIVAYLSWWPFWVLTVLMIFNCDLRLGRCLPRWRKEASQGTLRHLETTWTPQALWYVCIAQQIPCSRAMLSLPAGFSGASDSEAGNYCNTPKPKPIKFNLSKKRWNRPQAGQPAFLKNPTFAFSP